MQHQLPPALEPPAGEFPIVAEPITIQAFLCPTSMVRDYKDNEFTYWLEELTNINLGSRSRPWPSCSRS
ncbi:MAG: hypothetical protein R2856_33125 [Caldilineaceae bacterium]